MTREPITKKTMQSFMQIIGKTLKKNATFYLTGGSTAILYEWRQSTIDIDIAGDMNELFAHIPKLKERLQINIEMAKPTDFVPSLPKEKSRHIFIGEFGKVSFFHFDPFSQAFSKIVRAHKTDILDVKALIQEGLVDIQKLNQMVNNLPDKKFLKYPRLNVKAIKMAVKSFAKGH